MRWTIGLFGCVLSLACTPAATGPSRSTPPQPSPPTRRSTASTDDSPPATASVRPSSASRPSPTPPRYEPISFDADARRRIAKVQRYVHAAAHRRQLDPQLLNAIIWNESKFNPRARNRSGAKGLMQLMPRTSRGLAKRLERANRPYDPEFAVEAGALLLALLRDKFDGDVQLMLFGYARGSGSVRAWQKTNDSLPEGVQKFIAKVERARASLATLPEAQAPTTS